MMAKPIPPLDAEERAAELAELLDAMTADDSIMSVLGEERFHHFGVGVALARRVAALQGVDAGRCARLACAALIVCASQVSEQCIWHVLEEAAGVEESERVRALVGNALRLQGNGEEALKLMTWHRQLPRARGGELFEHHIFDF